MKIYMYHGKKNVCGQRVRELRKERGYTQTAFAVQLQSYNVWLDQKAISRIELEDRVVADYELWAIAKVLDVDVAELLQAMPEIHVDLDERMTRIRALRKKLADAEAEQNEAGNKS